VCLGTSIAAATHAVAADFNVSVADDVVIVSHVGRLEYHDTNRSIEAAAQAAAKAGTKLVLFDFTRADLANYYSYAVRHAEFAPELGLDTTYKIAFVGLPAAIDVLEFIQRVTRNRGWRAHYFLSLDEAVDWLHSSS
jgi:hypothetical protein